MKIRHPFLIQSIGLIGAWFVRLWMGTLRVESHFAEPHTDPTKKPVQRYIYAFYHENMLLSAYLYRNLNVAVLISNHADGEIIAQIIKRLGYSPIRGSSTRGGAKALLEMIRNAGRTHIVITPDGPKGPRRQVQPGIAMLAAATSLPVVPMSLEFRHCWRAKSWDRLALPKPFAKACLIIGPAIQPASAGLAGVGEMRQHIESSLYECARRAEHWRDHGEVLQEPFLQPIPVRKAG